MPSASACSTSWRLACIFSTAKIEVSVTSAPWRADTDATSCAAWPAIACSGRSLSRVASMWPSRRETVTTSIEVSPPPTTTTRLPTWRMRPSLNACRNAVAVTMLGASLRGQAQEHRIELGANLLHGDIDADPAFEPGFDAQVEDALNLGVEDVARRA